MPSPENVVPPPADHGLPWFLAAAPLLVFGFLACFYHYVLLGSYLGMRWPEASLGELPQILGNDLTRLMIVNADRNPYALLRVYTEWAAPYPPLAFLLYFLLNLLGLWPAILLFYGVAFGGLVWLIMSQLRFLPLPQRVICCLAFTAGAYPVVYAFDRANLDSWVLLAVWGAALVVEREAGWRRMVPAALLIGLAGAMKLYPFYYAVLFLARRDYRNFILCFVSGGLLSLGAALLLQGGVLAQIHGFLGEMRITQNCYSSYAICDNFSLLYSFKTILQAWGLDFAAHATFVQYAYHALCLALGVGTAWLIHHYRPPLSRTLVLASCMVLWLPIMSMQYKPILLLVPIFLLLRSADRRGVLIGLLLLFVLLPKRALELPFGGNGLNQLLLGTSFLLTVAFTLRPALLQEQVSWRLLQRGVLTLSLGLLAGYGWAAVRHIYVPAFTAVPGGLHFSQQDAPGHYAFGWGAFEQDAQSTWRWMQGCEAQINLRLYGTQDYRVRLTASTHARNPAQQLTLLFNGVPLGAQALPATGAVELIYVVPASAITPTKIVPDRLTLHSTQCAKPSEDAAAPLGIAFSSLRFERLP